METRAARAEPSRISGCLLRNPLEVLSFRAALDGVRRYVRNVEAMPSRICTPLDRMAQLFVNGEAPCLDLAKSSDSSCQDWIGGQIRVDSCVWACPGTPAHTAELTRRNASMFHCGDGVHAAAFIAALPSWGDVETTIDKALAEAAEQSLVAGGVHFSRSIADAADPVTRFHRHYRELTPLHAANNPAVVVRALCAHAGDSCATVREPVSAGSDTDCSRATAGVLCALVGTPIDHSSKMPWQGRIDTRLAGHSGLQLDLVFRSEVGVARTIQ